MTTRPQKKTSSPATKLHTKRLAAFRRHMKAHGLTHFLLQSPADILYFTGFRGDDSQLLIDGKKALIITDGRFTGEVELTSNTPYALANNKTLLAAQRVADCKKATLGIDALTCHVADFQLLTKRLGTKSVVPQSHPTMAIRVVKDAHEITTMKKALRIAQAAFKETLAYAEPGMTEKSVALFLENAMMTHGATGPSFDTIVAAGPNAALPHAVPGKRKLPKKGCLLIDWGAKYQHYCSDLTRMVLFGTPSKALSTVIDTVQAAQDSSIAKIRPNVTCAEVDMAGRSVIESAGYGPAFKHSTGHGVGIDIHEFPRLSTSSTTPLKAGMIVTVEPGIYLDGKFGVRLEEMVLVTKTGCERLSRLPMTFQT